MSKETVVKTIQKILNLANCPGASEGEIQNATAKAQALLEKHQLSMMDVLNEKNAEDSVIKEHEIHTDIQRLGINTRLIVSGVAKSFQCHMVFKVTQGGIIFTFIGLPEDTQVAAQMYDMLSKRLPAMGKERAHDRGCMTTGETRAFVTAYILGAMQAITGRLVRERQAREAANCQVTALVVRKGELIKNYVKSTYGDKLRSAPKSRCKIDIAGQEAGYNDGSRMGLNRPLKQGKD